MSQTKVADSEKERKEGRPKSKFAIILTSAAAATRWPLIFHDMKEFVGCVFNFVMCHTQKRDDNRELS
jgi:hypothetical protein